LTDAPETIGPPPRQPTGARRERWLAAFVVVVPALALVAALGRWAAGAAPSVTDLAVLAAGSFATLFGVELGFHRYYAHRAFDAHPALAWLLGALGSSAFLGPLLWWVATHRRHHASTDRPGDPHSPHWPHAGLRGLLHAHVGWLFRPAHTAMSLSAGDVKDLWKSPRTVAISRHYLLYGALGLAVPSLIGLCGGGARGALDGLLWGGLVRLFLVSQVVWAINSIGHSAGAPARLARSGQARNNFWLALLALGGGLHANHHDAPRAYTTRQAWWQPDAGGVLLWLLARLGVVDNLRRSRPRAGDNDLEACQ
jgi:stearoyl-CoA desaturase (delta-9 desaturase)